MKYDLDILILAAGMPIDGDTIPSGKSLGGSETCAIQLAESLIKRSHHVTLICNTEKPHEARGVYYMPIGWVGREGANPFPKGFFDYARSTPSDAIIVQRIPAFFGFEFASKANLLWQHDLATRTGPSNFHNTAWNINRLVTPSEFMRKQYQQVHGAPEKFYSVIPNGIDLGLIDESISDDIKRDRYRLLYTSRPERGLDILLRDVFPLILKKEPRARLYTSRYADPATLPLYQQLEAAGAQFGDRVVSMGNLGKRDLYRAYKSARLLLYPTQFEEIFCLTAAETGACGLPMIAAAKAALPETCGDAHVLLKEDGGIWRKGDATENGFGEHKREFIEAFANEAVALMNDDIRWHRTSRAARKRAEELTWESAAPKWEELIYQIIEERSSDPRRMVKHFIFNSDVVAAKKYAEKVGDEKLIASVNRHIERFVPFINASNESEMKQQMAEFYEQRSGGAGADYRTAFWADREPRTQVLIDLLRLKIAEGKIPADGTVLDFGCAHGGYVRAVSNAFPSLQVVGVDVSPTLIRCANQLLGAKFSETQPAFEHPENASFEVADEDWGIECPVGKPLDAVFCMEVLEHMPDAEAVVGKLEKLCKRDGLMIFTVPHGHMERDEFVNGGVPPCHVQSFDLHDLRDIFGKNEDYSVITFSGGKELELDKSMPGWFMVSYKNGQSGAGVIDWERKFALQGPRETMAVCMITNNTESVMHRCLRSVVKLADQIVVVDNGPSYDRTADVAQEYTSDVRAGTSPFWCYAHLGQHAPDQIMPGICEMAGFETPRNESIEDVWTDWILWIDADEQVLDNWQLSKYLRPNYYNGYALQQHHISVDPPGAIKRDIPVRLFRNNIGMKFYGLVHEHAEFGINKGIGNEFAIVGDFHIHHDGYLTETIRRGRFTRNLKLLECDRKKYPDRLLGIYLYEIRDSVHLARYEIEQNGGAMTPKAAEYYKRVIETFRKHFLGQNVLMAEDGINYYSEALARLGLGIEVALDVDVKKGGAHLNGGAKIFRVMNLDEAKLMATKAIERLGAPWEGPYVA